MTYCGLWTFWLRKEGLEDIIKPSESYTCVINYPPLGCKLEIINDA